jgi:hypothetical protein
MALYRCRVVMGAENKIANRGRSIISTTPRRMTGALPCSGAVRPTKPEPSRRGADGEFLDRRTFHQSNRR